MRLSCELRDLTEIEELPGEVASAMLRAADVLDGNIVTNEYIKKLREWSYSEDAHPRNLCSVIANAANEMETLIIENEKLKQTLKQLISNAEIEFLSK